MQAFLDVPAEGMLLAEFELWEHFHEPAGSVIIVSATGSPPEVRLMQPLYTPDDSLVASGRQIPRLPVCLSGRYDLLV